MEFDEIMDLDYNKVGQNMKHFRKLSKLTQDVLAERTGVSKQYLSLLEKGEKHGRLAIYYRVALALNITLDTLVGNQAPRNSALHHANLDERINNYSQEQYEKLLDYMDYLNYAADKADK